VYLIQHSIFQKNNLKKHNYEPLITFFISCFNEEKYILKTIKNVISAVKKIDISYEIIVIDDNSNDKSVLKIQEFIINNSKTPISLIVNKNNRGLAKNFFEAAIISNGKFFRLICGDNVESNHNIFNVIKNIGKADVIIPYHAKVLGKPKSRIVLSRIYTFLINIISGNNLKYYNGLCIFNRNDILRNQTPTSGFAFQAELLCNIMSNKKNVSHLEVPLKVKESKASGALNLNNLLSVIRVLLNIFINRVSSIVKRIN
jgi:glycosyltransferase involved in cell wall biosynthesis